MRKTALILIILIMFAACLAVEKVAVLSFDKKDRASDYVAKALMDRDFQEIFDEYENYDLINKKTVAKAIDKSGYTNLFYLSKEQISSIGSEVEANILIWGNVSSISNTDYTINAKILSMKSGDVIAVNFNVKKDGKQRIEAIKANLITRMEEFTRGEIDKLLSIAMQYFNSENYTSAQETYLNVLQIEDGNMEANFYLGLISFIERSYDESETYYLKALEAEPDNRDVLIYLSRTYLQQENYEEAIAALRTVAEKDNDLLIWMKIGEIYQENEDFNESLSAYETVLDLDPEYLPAGTAIAYLYYDQEMFEEAIPYFEAAALENPDDDDIQKKLATCYKRTGKLENAIKQYQDIIASQPDNIRAYLNLANAYAATEQYQNALEVAEIITTKAPDDPKGYIMLASSYSALKQNQKAEQNAEKAIELDDSMYQPYRILSDIYFARGYEKYENYLQLEEQAKTAYGQQADELVDKRDLAKAAAHDLFLQSDSFLDDALDRTDNLSEEKYIKSRKQTLEQLLNATKKDFF